MSVSTTSTSVAYTGDGTTVAFPVPLTFIASTDLVVTLAAVTKALGTDYTVTGGSDATGTVTFVTAPGSGLALVISRATPLTQPSALPTQGPFLPKALEQMSDRLTLLAQEQKAARDAQAAGLTTQMAALQVQIAALSVQVGPTWVDVRTYGAKGDDGAGNTDNTAALNAAIAANYGRVLCMPKGGYRISGPLLFATSLDPGGQMPIQLRGEGTDGNRGNGGTYLRVIGGNDGIQVSGVEASTNNTILLEDFGIYGDFTDADGGNGISYQRAAGLILRRLWIQGMRQNGILATDAWSSLIEDCVVSGNRLNGIYVHNRFNNGVIRRCKVLTNGKVYSQQTANIFINADVSYESLGPVIEATDFSYAGQGAFKPFFMSNGSLVSITITSNVGTVTTANPHGLSVGQKFCINGSLTVDSDPYPYTVASKTSTTFTFAITHADTVGPISFSTDPFLAITPSALGLSVSGVRGMLVLGAYCEDASDSAIYLGPNIQGFRVTGGFIHGQYLLVDGPSLVGGRVDDVYFSAGQRNASGSPGKAGLYNGMSDFDVGATNVFGANTRFVEARLQKRDGRYIGSGAPNDADGAVGDFYFRTDPTAGAGSLIYQKTSGSPAWVGIA